MEFPNLKLEVAARQYEAMTNGGSDPVAEFSCEECDEPFVSLDESLCDVGKCVNCGHEQVLENCLRCEELYNPNLEGRGQFCDSCHNYLNRD